MTRNIGLPVNEPKEKPLKNEKDNPFNGSLTIRGKLFEGIVINAKAKRTAVIQKESLIYFEKFNSPIKIKTMLFQWFCVTSYKVKKSLSTLKFNGRIKLFSSCIKQQLSCFRV